MDKLPKPDPDLIIYEESLGSKFDDFLCIGSVLFVLICIIVYIFK